MHLDSDWEFFYAQGLVDFAHATDDRREAANSLMNPPDVIGVEHSFTARELERAQSYARDGLAMALRWDGLSEAAKRSYLKKLDARLPKDVNVAVGFSLEDGLQMSTIGAPDTSLMGHVALGLALLVGDNSPWRMRLAHCNLESCGKVFVRGGIGKGKPPGTCSIEHAEELHRGQMRRANARKHK
jgi:hypothetical protein